MKGSFIPIVILIVVGCGNSAKDHTNKNMHLAYEELLQMVLDAKPLQSQFHRTKDGSFYPVVIADDAARWREPQPEVYKFGKPVRFVSKSEADSIGLEAYFWVTDYDYVDSTARIQLFDPVRKLLFGVSFLRSDGQWTIESAHMQEL
jgi:hypothetical protein